MEREEAIQWLTNEKWKNANNKYKKEWNEAFEMAIEALSAERLYTHEEAWGMAELKPEFESAEPNCQKCAIKELWKATEKEDLVEVVRCKDCRQYIPHDLTEAYGWCCEFKTPIEEDDFCSRGERREE